MTRALLTLNVHRHRCRPQLARLEPRRMDAGAICLPMIRPGWCAESSLPASAAARLRRSATAFWPSSPPATHALALCPGPSPPSPHELGIDIRVGMHTGECELIGADVGGMAVHIASRIRRPRQTRVRCSSRTRFGGRSWVAHLGSKSEAFTSSRASPAAWRSLPSALKARSRRHCSRTVSPARGRRCWATPFVLWPRAGRATPSATKGRPAAATVASQNCCKYGSGAVGVTA